MGRIINVRTSGRSSFQRCRRRWNWTDDTRGNLEPKQKPAPFFLGSAFHFALEDMHGYKRYKSGAEAIRAFALAQKLAHCPIPDDHQELVALGEGMMNHYDTWLKNREMINLHKVNGVFQAEVTFKIPMTSALQHLPLQEWGIDEVNYSGTFDGIVRDREGRLWIMEYKTAQQFQLLHFETDRQISAYCWAASCLYNEPVMGVIYQQHKKTLPDLPKLLSNGTYSTAKTQTTTHQYYSDALKNLYGATHKAPPANIKTLNALAMEETEDRDRYVKRDRIYRNQHQIEAEGTKIIAEMADYLNPDIPLYPNPTKDCSWDCSAQNACILLDSGLDWQHDLDDVMTQRDEDETPWRECLPTSA